MGIEQLRILQIFFVAGIIFYTTFTSTNNDKIMATTSTPFKNKRDAMLELANVTNTNVFGYAARLMRSLRENTVTSEQYSLLCGDLQLHCQQNGIDSTCGHANVSLF